MNYKQIIFVSIISVFIISLILIIVFYPPNSKNINTDLVEKTIHYVSHISDAHQEVINQFNEKYKGRIQIEAIDLPFEKFSTNERKELLARYLRSKSDRIDVFTVDQIWVPRFAKWSVNLEKYFSVKERNELLTKALKTCNFNDSLVAVPLYLDVAVMFYRNDILMKIPEYNSFIKKLRNSVTWSDLINFKSNRLKKTEPIFLFTADNYEGLMCMFVELMESQGKSLVEEGILQLSSSEAYNAVNLMVDLVNKYGITPKEVVNFKENEVYNLFINNNFFLLRGWPAFLKEYPKLKKENNLEYQIEMVPTPHFKDGKTVSSFGGWNLMVSKFSPNFEEAVIFIKYLLSKEAQLIMYKQGNYLPILNDFYENKDDEKLKFYQRLINHGVYRPFLENYTRISDIITNFINKAIKKEITVEQALRGADEEIRINNIEIK